MHLTETEAQALSLSRSTGLPAAMGKATAELKTKVPDVVSDDFTKLCRALGLSVSEMLRDMVVVRCYGYDAVQRMQADRLRMASGVGPESALIQAADQSITTRQDATT